MTTPLPSPRHNKALQRPTGYRRVVEVTLERGLRTLTVEPTALSLTQDARRNMRWSGTATFVGADIQPTRPGDMLTPFGTRVTVRVGVELSDGSRSTVPYGVYSISSASTSTDASSHTTQVSLVDLADQVDRYRFETPMNLSSGTDLAQVVNLVIANRTGINPGLANVGRSLTANRVLGLDPETGPWKELIDVLDGFGYTIWYDRSGQVQIGLSTPASLDGVALVGPLTASAKFDSRPYNVVIVRGEPVDGTPIQAEAFDNDPGSPTYAGDDLDDPPSTPYGRVTRYYSSNLITTPAQASAAASSLLASSLGGGAAFAFTRPFDPTMDATDVVNYGGKSYVIDSVTLDLSGQTTAAARSL